MTAKVGDTVRFLNSVGGGRVTRIEGQIAYVDEDGFETPALLRECVVVAGGDSFYRRDTPPRQPAQQPAPGAIHTHRPAPSKEVAPEGPTLPPARETPEGEVLDLLLAFEPADIKRLSDTSFDAFMVNASNFALYVAVATRPNESDAWTLRYRGFIEPGTCEFLFELTTADLPAVDRVSVQAIAFKTGSDFTRKPAIDFEQRLDATRFARLHCFGDNPYFDSKVLAVPVVTDGRIATAPRIDADELRRSLAEKQRDDRRRSRPVTKQSRPSRPANDILEVDLHASELLDNLNGLSKADILNYQVDTFRRIMDENLRNHGRRIVFIHGKGEGVLRSALMKELNHRYKGHDVADASFREYGFGATQVTIR